MTSLIHTVHSESAVSRINDTTVLTLTDDDASEWDPFEIPDEIPWDDVDSARSDWQLQRRHPNAAARARLAPFARECPCCKQTANQLSWFYFRSPAWTWHRACGIAGWMTVCDACHQQVSFFSDHTH